MKERKKDNIESLKGSEKEENHFPSTHTWRANFIDQSFELSWDVYSPIILISERSALKDIESEIFFKKLKYFNAAVTILP